MPKVHPTETDFAEMMQNDNIEQFAVLYDAYSAALLGVIKRIVRDINTAEDVLQDSFIKIWQKRQSYDSSKGSIFTWMLNIARNTAIDYTRSKHFKSSSKIQKMDDDVGLINRMNNTSTNTDAIGIAEVVQKLPTEQRRIIDLMYFNGMSQDEIATEFNIPLGTVKTRARGAIGKLREVFNLKSST